MQIIQKITVFLLILLIKLYQNTISKLTPGHCRFYPTCSNYFIEALKIHGLFKGFIMGCSRIGRCNPFFEGGIDEVRSKHSC